MNTILFDGKTVTPSKVVCIGRNYVEHIAELNNEIPDEPVVFCKPNSAVSDELCSHPTDEIHYEGEICFLVLNNKLAAVGFGLDLTKREIQSQLKSKGLPWERAKAFDKAAVFSEFIAFDNNLTALKMQLLINNIPVQCGGYDLMMYKPDRILDEISSFMTLVDGDIIMTGTPKGVGKINQGDTFTGSIFSGDTLLLEKNWLVK